MQHRHFLRRCLQAGAALGGALWAGGAMAAAAGTVTYAPVGDAASVPLLTDIGLPLLAALVAVAAFRVLRNRAAGRPLASVAALAVLAAGGWAAGRLEPSAAHAAPAPLYSLSSASGGTVSVDEIYEGQQVTLTNNTSKMLKISSVQAAIGYTLTLAMSSCTSGVTVLPPLASCTVQFD